MRRRTPPIASVAVAALLGACATTPGPTTAPARPAPRASFTPPAPAPTSVVVDARAWSFEGIPGQRMATPSFSIYTTLSDSMLLAALPPFLEFALARYVSALGDLPRPRDPLETFVVQTRGQWTRVTQRLMGDDAAVYLRITRGGFAARGRAVYYDIGHHDTLAVAAHEGWHQYSQAVFADPPPVWLDEGVAAWMEGFALDPRDPTRPLFMPWANAERLDELRRAAADLRPLAELLSTRPQDEISASSTRALRYYAQVWALVHFLNEGDAGAHRQALHAMLADAAQGSLYDSVHARLGEREARNARVTRTGSAVLSAYLPSLTLDELDARYRAFVARITRPGARDLALKGSSPVP